MERKVIKARDVMQEKHVALDGMATVSQALEAMKAHKAEIVIVNKRSEHDAFGIVLLSDIAKRVLARDRSPQRVNIYEIMSKPVFTLSADMDIRYAARMLDRFGLSRAPVVEEGEVVGIVSVTDMVLKGLYKNL